MSDSVPLTREELLTSIFGEPLSDEGAQESNKEWNEYLAKDAPDRAEIQKELATALADVTSTHLRPDTVAYFQGMVPFQAWGKTAEGSWYFRFRGDNATLCLGPGQEDSGYTPDEFVTFSASHLGVTGDWRAGSLGRDRVIELIVELWDSLVPGPK
jgi:hypothetical protein